MFTRFMVLFVAVCIHPLVTSGNLPTIPEATDQILEDFSSLRAVDRWRPMAGSPPVSIEDIVGRKAVRMPCHFQDTKIDRASWDCELAVDLTMCKGLQFLFFCRDTTPVAYFTVYLHSGNGWYRIPFDAPATTGWTPIKIYKKDAGVEEQPAGWGKIDTIRISAWRGQDKDTEFYIASLGTFGSGGKIVVVRGDSAAREAPGELNAIKRYTNVMTEFLDRANLSHIILSDLDVTTERLAGIKLLILPYNPAVPDELVDEIETFLERGGKLIACYTLPKRLESVVGIHVDAHIRQKFQGQFASIRPTGDALPGMPVVARQSSWNIRDASTVEGRSQVVAWWYDNNNQPTDKAAVVAGQNCVFLTHVLMSDDSSAKLRLLLAMAGYLVPELWRDAAQGCLERIGQLEPFDRYDSAKKDITATALGNHRAIEVLHEADRLRNQSRELISEGRYSDAIVVAEQSQDSLIAAHCIAQKPLPGEHRAFWCHSAFGVDGMTWDQAIHVLAENGFTAILPNMLWGGAAFYRSDVLPVSPAVEEKGDQIELCLAACKQYGVQCHVWKVNYNMGSATDKRFVAKMKAQNRTQVGFDGSTNERWLCPSHPENQKMEIESMLEVARKYDVHGLHFDYIRYPGNDGCFCDGCRQRFETVIGKTLDDWPACVRNDDVLSEQWLDFRRQQITKVVADVAEGAKKIRADVKISAAVFRNWPVDRNTIGQDWKLWCDRGYLDFVCPMDYTASSSHFQRMVEQQLPWAGKVPCYPGIGLSVWSDATDICKLIEQINMTRRLATGGFTIFNYGSAQAHQVLPLLGQGLTQKR
ncbi:MAG: family 10 glycosylhydrolase [Sedimentisphaerales bacterium]|nr:family 10 glycosylhydrolase [Sedimentisphaerales bacterium]